MEDEVMTLSVSSVVASRIDGAARSAVLYEMMR